jgi:hypothetical protein
VDGEWALRVETLTEDMDAQIEQVSSRDQAPVEAAD